MHYIKLFYLAMPKAPTKHTNYTQYTNVNSCQMVFNIIIIKCFLACSREHWSEPFMLSQFFVCVVFHSLCSMHLLRELSNKHTATANITDSFELMQKTFTDEFCHGFSLFFSLTRYVRINSRINEGKPIYCG